MNGQISNISNPSSKVAEVNDKVNGEDYVIRVLHLDSHRIDKVRIIKLVTEINEEDN